MITARAEPTTPALTAGTATGNRPVQRRGGGATDAQRTGVTGHRQLTPVTRHWPRVLRWTVTSQPLVTLSTSSSKAEGS